MNKIKLDPSKLLGFKIVASDGSVGKLQSPKIGAKGCAMIGAVTFDTPVDMRPATRA